MVDSNLDEVDVRILSILSRNCRTSYYSIGSQIGLSPKAIKNRIIKLQKGNVIDKFTLKLNLSILDYHQFHFLVLKFDQVNRRDNTIASIKEICDLIGRLDCLGNVTIVHLATKKENESKFNSFLSNQESIIIKYETILYPNIIRQLDETDLKIIRCLLLDPKIEISDIAKSIDRSSRTVKRRLEKLTNNQVIELTVLCNIKIMPGFLISVMIFNVDQRFYTDIIKQIYSNLEHSFMLRSPFIGLNNKLICILCFRDVKSLNRFSNKMENNITIENIDNFIATNLEYYPQIAVSEIEKRLVRKTRILKL